MSIQEMCEVMTNEYVVMEVIDKLKGRPHYILEHIDNQKKIDALFDIYFKGNPEGRQRDPRVEDSLRGYKLLRTAVTITATSALVDGQWRVQDARIMCTNRLGETKELHPKEDIVALMQRWLEPQSASTDAKAIVYCLIHE